MAHFEDGRWGAIEVKLGSDKLIEDGASSLLNLQAKIEEESAMCALIFLMVLCVVGLTYVRKGGVVVAPPTDLGV